MPFVALLVVLLSSPAYAVVIFNSYTTLPLRAYSEFEGFENPLDYNSNIHNYYFDDFSAYFSTAGRMSMGLTANGYGDEGHFALLTSFNYTNQYIEFSFNQSLSSLMFFVDSQGTMPSELYGRVYDGDQLVHNGHDYYLKTTSVTTAIIPV